MPHASSQLIKFTFSYKNSYAPMIPIRFIGENNQRTPIFNAILDSGADEITIPRRLADYLGQTLTPKQHPINTAGGTKDAFTTKTHFFIGRGGREVEYEDISTCVVNTDMPVLVGIYPVFEDYIITINASKNKFSMIPLR